MDILYTWDKCYEFHSQLYIGHEGQKIPNQAKVQSLRKWKLCDLLKYEMKIQCMELYGLRLT